MEGKAVVEAETKKKLLEKGDLDLRNAVLRLIHVQSAVFLHVTGYHISGVLNNFQGFQKELRNIDKASTDIKAISNKTRLLSVNAAIEATHAGSVGRGFGVVAEEIGILSTQTTKCNDEVKKVNESMSKNAQSNQQALDELDACLRRFEKSNEMVLEDVLKLSEVEDNGFIVTTLAKRLENHADFMQNLINNAGKSAQLKDHDTCAFGIWYNENKIKYRGMPEYEAIYEPHREFHNAGIEFNKTLNIGVLVRFLELSDDILEHFLDLAAAFKKLAETDDHYFMI